MACCLSGNFRGGSTMSIEIIGWLSATILLLTLIRQVYTQWRERSAIGVSRWLFIGQLLASTGFIIYSVLVSNWVFVVTNSLILLTALVGQVVMMSNRRRAQVAGSGADPDRVVPFARHQPRAAKPNSRSHVR
jgi:MtN3 and saliva related transmembrane protein